MGVANHSESNTNHMMWEEGIIPKGDLNRPAGMRVFWMCGDSEKNFRKNPKPGYNETSITYDYNSHGFRTAEFDLTSSKPNILFLGCSHTEGIGLKVEDTWVHKVSKNFPSHNCYNFGVGGGSPDMVARFLYNTCKIFKPDAVFIMWPCSLRFETYETFLIDEPWLPLSPTKRGQWDMTKETMFLYSDGHAYHSFMKNRAIVNLLKTVYNFKLVEFVDEEIDPLVLSLYPITDSARDDHLPPSVHTAISQIMMNRYNNLNDNSTI